MLNQEDVVNKAYENYLLLSCRSKKRARETNEKFNLQSNDMDETNQNVSISSGMAYDCLFVKVEDHYEIADKFKEYISVLDFTNVNFDNVDIRGIDFTGATGGKNKSSKDLQQRFKRMYF